jgi:predicted Rossmann fold nucleotide-binding protein DprA/Smf involved in DNA uptake
MGNPVPVGDVVLLACSGLAARRGSRAKPLGPKGWASLRERARGAGIELGELPGMSAADFEGRLRVTPEKADQLAELLGRHGQLAFEKERIERLGMWWVTVEEDDYPGILGRRLGDGAPPVLFGLGSHDLAGRDGLAVVGSRDAPPAALELARVAGAQAAGQGWVLVSGAAKGVDAASMRGAFDAGGSVLGVTPDGLERHLRDASLRTAFSEGQATYVSPYRPDARFSVGSAMGRNKLIYALATAALVVHTSAGSGGTWSGAIEVLKQGWAPLYVNADDEIPDGNQQLIDRGGIPITPSDLEDLAGLPAPSEDTAQAPDPAELHSQQRLFDS